ncbi:STAS domain-containing protein [Cohnella sp. WQ 127256]|uniref:STAS domain-containing protein n=1 Tax=Cohnella sp. WQ 127256 TaxID=2938790 RepID=UPI0021199F65|nr:STAS domain-containing protein [Cohnella sp. WQ 127256]
MIHEIVVDNGEIILRLHGKIYVDEAALIKEKLFPFIDRGYSQFVVHLSDVTYIDSSGLGMLVAVQKKARQIGGGVKLVGLQGGVLELFELTRLTSVFERE